MQTKMIEELARENEELRERLREAEEALEAIRRGEVDALVIDRGEGVSQIYTLEESDRTYRQMIETMRQGAVLVLEDGGIYYCNHAFARMVGRPLERIIGSSIFDYIHNEDAGRLRELIERGRDGGADYELLFLAEDGTCVPTLAAASLLRQSEIHAVCLAITDLSDMTALEHALDALAESDRVKDEFLAMLSHELRNPLAPIRNAVHILQVVGTVDPIKRRQHEIIERQITHMARLLDDLLDVARITRGKITLQPQPLNLADLLVDAAEAITPQMHSRSQSLEFLPPPADLRINGDPDRLNQVIGNLLINATKFTPEDGRIWLEAGRDGTQAVIRVRDNGIGIAPEMLPRIFEPFIQADRTLDRKAGGLGIGLTLAKKLVELHGGSIEGRSAGLGCGAEFIVRLPALGAPGQGDGAPIGGERALQRGPVCRRVLVVDDVVDSAASLAELVEIWGHEARQAHSGPAALKEAREWRPEVVLLDIGLPGMDGFEVAHCLREEFGKDAMVLMAMTGYGQLQDREATLAAGFDHHLVKPLDLNELRELLLRP